MLKHFNRKFRIFFYLKNFIADIFCFIFLLNFPNKWSVVIASRLNNLFCGVAIKGRNFRLHSHTAILCEKAKAFYSNEPETTYWIEQMPPNGIFYDVGANIGAYSILASAYCRRVYAFEPSALNFSVLNQNLMANSLDDKIMAYCLAINDQFSFDTLRLRNNKVGSSHHIFGTNKDICHHDFSPIFKQGALGISLDDLVYKYNFECPTYLKIDIDGNQHLVIRGAEQLLKDERLISILIEVNCDLQVDLDLIQSIERSGFKISGSGSEIIYKGMQIGNIVFSRNIR